MPVLASRPRSQDYVYLGRLIGHYLADLFPGTKLLGYWLFRVTRNSELYIDEEETANLLKAVEIELRNRRKGDAVRLEIDHACPATVRTPLLRTLQLTEDDLYLVHGPLNPARLLMLGDGVELESARHLAAELGISRRVTFLGAVSKVAEVLALHVGHGEPEQVAHFARVEDPENVGVLEPARHPDLALEPVLAHRARECGIQHLEGDVAAGAGLDVATARGDAGQNGIPDILDEARWGLEWMLKLHPTPDALYHQVADDRDHCGPRLPYAEIADYGWGKGSNRVVYFADGQQRDEVYTWGSFIQSRMHAAGVTCTDCHDPHAAKLRAPGSAARPRPPPATPRSTCRC